MLAHKCAFMVPGPALLFYSPFVDEKDEQCKIAIRANMEEYLARAEVLKKCI